MTSRDCDFERHPPPPPECRWPTKSGSSRRRSSARTLPRSSPLVLRHRVSRHPREPRMGREVRGGDRIGADSRQQAGQMQPVPSTRSAVERAGGASRQQAIPGCGPGDYHEDGSTMSSNLLPCESFKHFFAKAGNIIFPTDWAANKIGETSMRAVCHLDKASNTGTGPKPKTTLLLFPRSAEEMNLLSDSTQSPAWPGIRILQVTSEFFPMMPNWKDPVCPLLLLGSMYHEAPHLPSLADIRFNIAAP